MWISRKEYIKLKSNTTLEELNRKLAGTDRRYPYKDIVVVSLKELEDIQDELFTAKEEIYASAREEIAKYKKMYLDELDKRENLVNELKRRN